MGLALLGPSTLPDHLPLARPNHSLLLLSVLALDVFTQGHCTARITCKRTIYDCTSPKVGFDRMGYCSIIYYYKYLDVETQAYVGARIYPQLV